MDQEHTDSLRPLAHYDYEQGSDAWIRCRLGIMSASKADSIITGTGKPSSQWQGYMAELLAEWITGEPTLFEETDWMKRGRELEPEAVRWYEMEREVDTTPVGFLRDPHLLAGCSPDRTIGRMGGLEIKCPSPKWHARYMVDSNELVKRYKQQVQWSLWITGRHYWDLVSYHPEMFPGVIVRIDRDEGYIRKIDEYARACHGDLSEMRINLLARGCKPKGDTPVPETGDIGDAA